MKCFRYTPDTIFGEEFPSGYVLVRSFSYTLHAMFSEEFLLQSPCYNRTGWLGVKHQFTYFSYSSDARFSEEFLLHSSCYVFGEEFCLTLLELGLVKCFSYTTQGMF